MSAPTIYKQGRTFLAEMFAEQKCHHGAEIGVWEGAFAERLCKANPQLHLICVDPWAPQKGYNEVKNDERRLNAAFDIAQQRLRPYDVSFMRMTSMEAATRVPDGSLDFVYLDGNHALAHVLADLRAWTPKVRPSGFIAGHDYKDYANKKFIEVKAAVDQFTQERGIDEWFVLAGDKSPSFYWQVK